MTSEAKSLLPGHPVHCGMCGSLPVLHPLDASSAPPPPVATTLKCLQTFWNVHWGAKSLLVESQGSRWSRARVVIVPSFQLFFKIAVPQNEKSGKLTILVRGVSLPSLKNDVQLREPWSGKMKMTSYQENWSRLRKFSNREVHYSDPVISIWGLWIAISSSQNQEAFTNAEAASSCRGHCYLTGYSIHLLKS